MDVSVIVGTYGSTLWTKFATERAIPSAQAQTAPAREVLHVHGATLHGARNSGAHLAKGEWLCFLDADDELHPDYLAAMTAGTADLLAPAVQYVDPYGKRGPVQQLDPIPLERGNYLVIGTLVRRDLFHAVGGFKDWPFYEDWCLWLRCHLAGATVQTIPDAVYIAHARPGSRNRRPGRAEREQVHHAIAAAAGVA